MIPIRNTRDGVEPLTLLLYGPPGAGKTTLCSSFPRPVFLDCDGGLRTVASRGVDYLRCGTLPHLQQAIIAVEQALDAYDTIVVDSLTELARTVVEAECLSAGTGNGGRPTLQIWARVITVVGTMVRRLRRAGKTLVLTALDRETRDAHGAVTNVRPALPGQLARDIAALSDLVLYIAPSGTGDDGEGWTPVITTKQNRCVYAKDRSGALPRRMRATIDPLFAAGLLLRPTAPEPRAATV